MAKKKYNVQRSFGYDKNGKRIIKWFHADSKDDLQRQISDYRAQLKYTPNISTVTFGEYSKMWAKTYKGNLSKQTQDMYRYALRHCEPICDAPLAKITKSMCQEVMSGVWDKPRTAKIVASTMKQVFDCAIADGIILRNPSVSLSAPKKPSPKFYLLSKDELEAVDRAELNQHDRMFVTILKTFGLRPSEALALTVHDFDLDNRVLHITKSLELSNDNKSQIKSTKTGASRDIPIPFSLIPLLRDYFASNPSFYLFTNKDNMLHTKSSYRRLSERTLRAINKAMGGTDNMNLIKGCTLYSFRHRRATDLFYLTQDGTISILQASQLLGHSVQVFLNTYAHIDEDKENLQNIYPEERVTSV